MIIIQLCVVMIMVIAVAAYLVFSQKKEIKKKKEMYINRKLINLSMQKDMLAIKNAFDDYEMLLKEVEKLLKMLDSEGGFQFKGLKLKRVSAFDYVNNTEELHYMKRFYVELENLRENDQYTFDFVTEVLNTKREIISMNFAFKLILFKILDFAEILIIRILIFVLERIGFGSNSDKFKDIDSFNPEMNDEICVA